MPPHTSTLTTFLGLPLKTVLENRHVACLYSLLLAKPALDIFARLEPGQWREARKMVIGAVLATDMVHQ